MVAQHVPGLLPAQTDAILARTDGNPQFLEEIVAFVLRRPRLFEALDARRALTPKGFDEVMTATALGRHEPNTIHSGTPSGSARDAGHRSLQGQRLLQQLTAEVSDLPRLVR